MTRVLIVDDKEENLYYLQALLKGHGFAVVVAHHGAEALIKARQAPPDLVVSDLLMPVMDGYTLLRHWKADKRLGHAPFIVYTATYTEAEDERLALSLGADAFILKPAEPEDFLLRIREVQAKGPGAVPARTSGDQEETLLKSYSETLIRKLEEKTLQLEETNQALQRDIAERKRVEERLLQSEQRFRELAETIQEVFWMTDPAERRVLYISPAYEEIWGRSCTSLYENPSTWLEAIHPDDRARVRQAAETKQARGEYDETYRIVRSDGTKRWIRDRAFPVHGPAGEVLRIVGTAEDITDRRRLEDQFRQAQKMEALGTLAGGIAHDFNNIVGAILGNVELARQDVGAGPAMESLDEIRKASLRAKDLVERILAFGSPHQGQRKVTSLRPVVEEALSLLRATCPKGIEVTATFDDEAPAVVADTTQIHQILINLCNNAWHAMAGRAGRLDVRLDGVTVDAGAARAIPPLWPGRFARLSVTDTGIGMDAETLERIFDPFFTTKPVGQGTGLGLSVVHGIVKVHGGAIAVASQPGRGTTFTLYFLAAVEPTRAAAAQDRAPDLGHGGG